MDIGEPIRRFTVVPQVVPDPAAPAPPPRREPERAPAEEPEKIPA